MSSNEGTALIPIYMGCGLHILDVSAWFAMHFFFTELSEIAIGHRQEGCSGSGNRKTYASN